MVPSRVELTVVGPIPANRSVVLDFPDQDIQKLQHLIRKSPDLLAGFLRKNDRPFLTHIVPFLSALSSNNKRDYRAGTEAPVLIIKVCSKGRSTQVRE